MAFQILASPGFPAWLRLVNISLAFSTYQLGKLFLIGTRDGVRLSVFERTFDRCMGLWSDSQTLWLASAFQLWRLENVLDEGVLTSDGYDRLFVPMAAQTTSDIDVHDIALDNQRQLLFVNTLFSCLARISSRWSFEPVWRPPFIRRLAAEDRCHLNGLAMDAGQPAYVTACSQTDTAEGWRDRRRDGGCLVGVRQHEVMIERLSMPHSPRLHGGQLWLLDSGRGYFGRVDLRRGIFEPLVFCPGYARGLAFVDRFAIVGVSRPRRERTFRGLELDEELERRQTPPCCGLWVIDWERGQVVEWLQVEGQVDELYDVIALPRVVCPKLLGLKTDEIRRQVWFVEQDRVISWSASHPPEQS